MTEAVAPLPAAKLAYSVAEVVAITPFSRATLYREIAAGNLPAKKRGSSTFILAEDLDAFLKGAPAATGESVQ